MSESEGFVCGGAWKMWIERIYFIFPFIDHCIRNLSDSWALICLLGCTLVLAFERNRLWFGVDVHQKASITSFVCLWRWYSWLDRDGKVDFVVSSEKKTKASRKALPATLLTSSTTDNNVVRQFNSIQLSFHTKPVNNDDKLSQFDVNYHRT